MTTHYYIFLENVRFYSYHGVAPQETAIGNEFIINLRLKTDFGKATETDEVEDTVRDFPKISEIEIKLSKRNPPMGADIDSAGVEMHCTRD